LDPESDLERTGSARDPFAEVDEIGAAIRLPVRLAIAVPLVHRDVREVALVREEAKLAEPESVNVPTAGT
jgi:hypothetical protein